MANQEIEQIEENTGTNPQMIQDLIQYSIMENAVKVQETFSELIIEKISDLLAERAVAMAEGMFSPPRDPEDDEVVDEEDDEFEVDDDDLEFEDDEEVDDGTSEDDPEGDDAEDDEVLEIED